MSSLCKTLFTASLALFLNVPFSASANEVVPDAAVPEMHTMHDLMREMRQGQDPENCKTSALYPAEPAAVTNMPYKSKDVTSAEPCKLGEGKPDCKQANRKQANFKQDDCNKLCMQNGQKDCRMHGNDDGARLQELEKRMDMMQLMLEMMLRSAVGNR